MIDVSDLFYHKNQKFIFLYEITSVARMSITQVVTMHIL